MGIDDIDRQFRKPKKPEIALEPPEEGNCCPDPKCGGLLLIKTSGAGAGTYLQLACAKCDARFEETCP